MNLTEKVELLLDSGIDVMIHGRSVASRERAGTERWFIELDRYPVAATAEGDGDVEELLEEAIAKFFKRLARHHEAQAVINP